MAVKRYEDKNGRNPTRAEQGRLARLRAGQQAAHTPPDWARIDGDMLRALIAELTKDDGAVLFGYTSDGGVYSMTVFAGGDKEKFYHKSDEEVYIFIQEVLRSE